MDIYFTPEWAEVNQYIEDGKPCRFELKNEYGCISYQFMLREIPWKINGKQYFDIRSLYGYGGPYIENYTDKSKLLEEFDKRFQSYCEDKNIVSEFIRFHPIVKNAEDFSEIYRPQYMRHTVGTDLTKDDPTREEFSKSARKCIRRALKAGVTWKVDENPQNVEDFIHVYYSTMNRDQASDFYYFPEEYFQNCLDIFGEQIILVKAVYNNIVIAAGFYVTSGTTIHAHLSGTLSKFLNLSPAYVIKYATAVWGKEHGYKLIHYGGGTSNEPENSLFQFKSKFTKDTFFDFYTGKKIRNQVIYDALCRMRNVQSREDEFFPQYRGGVD